MQAVLLASLEEIEQLNQQDNNHRKFQKKHSRLLKFVDQEAVKLGRGAKLVANKFLVLDHADFRRTYLVQPGRKHVADKLERVGSMFGELGHLQPHGSEPRDRGLHAPCPPLALPRLHKAVNLLQLPGKHLIIVAKLEKLRVGVLQQADDA